MPNNAKCKFNQLWLQEEEYKDWLAPYHSDNTRANCVICGKHFSLSTMGTTALRSHAKGTNHLKKLAKSSGQVTLSNFIASSSTPTTAGSSVTSISSAPKQMDISGFVKNQNVLKAETLWILNSVTSHWSCKSAGDSIHVLKLMFPDNEIARRMSCAETKCAYVTNFGIAPHFSQLLTDRVKNQRNHVLLFDESLNDNLQSKQMDVHVRFWEDDQVRINATYKTFKCYYNFFYIYLFFPGLYTIPHFGFYGTRYSCGSISKIIADLHGHWLSQIGTDIHGWAERKLESL